MKFSNDTQPVLSVRHLKKYFPAARQEGFFRKKRWIHAVDDVSFDVKKGETLGIVGESGCGKTTLGRCIAGLYELTEGQVLIQGKPVSHRSSKSRKALSLDIQMIFQDSLESLDSRQTVEQILQEKFVIHSKPKAGMTKDIMNLLNQVGLSKDALTKFPHEFSGGQRQRIGIARAISLNPKIIVCDEPVSSLDMSVQSRILNLLLALQNHLGLTFVFISHDLSVIRHISDHIAVMYLGRLVEMAPAPVLIRHPRHPYTRALLSAVPVPDPDQPRRRIVLEGEIPSMEHPPHGCRFNTRCPYRTHICMEKEPVLELRNESPPHFSACHFDGTLW